MSSPTKLLVEASRISEGGGAVLLRYFSAYLSTYSKQPVSIVIRPDLPVDESLANIIWIRDKVTLLNRRQRFKEWVKRTSPSVILCFGNFPPPLKLPGIRVVTLFHRMTLLPSETAFTLTYRMLNLYLRYTARYSDEWFVQTELVKLQLVKHTTASPSTVQTYPFYSDSTIQEVYASSDKTQCGKPLNSFLYVSTATAHKNHLRLLEGWEILAKRQLYPSLVLTIFEDSIFSAQIQALRAIGCNIHCVGHLSHKEALLSTLHTKFAIYPSLKESFGLGLVEAAQLDAQLICADLAYTHEAVKPSLLFDPYNPDSIADAVETALIQKDLPPTESRLSNQIESLCKDLLS